MKEKNHLYESSKNAHFQTLSTLNLFARNERGELVYSPRWHQPHPEIAERRGARRFEWRKTAHCRLVASNGDLGEWQAVWGCEVSRGGFSLLAEQDLPVGCFIDLQLDDVAEVGELPLAEVVQRTRKGGVWLVRCRWLHELHKPGVRLLVGKQKKAKAQPTEPAGSEQNWLLRLWSLFHSR